ncbi:MAG: family 43 glycosylhydrolase [Rubrobacteraceae bacterium]
MARNNVMVRGILLVFCLALGTVLAVFSQSGGLAREAAGGSYTNPVSKGTVDTFPDPVSIRAKDGYWYAYTSTEPVLQSKGDDSDHYLSTIRSDDMVNWEYVGDVFTEETRPDWHPEGSRLWAPDVRYLNGKYYLYYSVAKPPPGPDDFFTVGVATAPTPTGPWADSGGPVIPPKGACDTFTDIDPAQYTGPDGTRYMLWGSFRNLCVAEMNAEATRVVGPVREVYKGPVEGGYVVRHDGYYYLFASESNCCFGEFSGYQVRVGRSESPTGPFVDREGIPLTAQKTKGAFVLSANGNKWVGPGHQSITTDLAGQDWLVYHAIDKTDPFMDPPRENINRRQLLIDRLDWIDGWPVVRAGEWASEDGQPAPVTEWAAGSEFNDEERLDAGWRREGAARDGWRKASAEDTLGYVRQAAPARRASYLVSRDQAPADVRAEADLRLPAGSSGAAGLLVAYRDPNNHVVAWLDAGANALVTDALVAGRSAGRRTTPLPDDFRFGDWHNVAVEIRGTSMSVEVTEARMGDPVAVQDRALPATAAGAGSVGVASSKARTEADNVGAAPLYEPAKEVEPPDVGALDPAYSDEFDDGVQPATEPGSPWSWVRQPEGQETDGVYRWPTDGKDLFANDDSASVLVRDAPEGEYTVEVKLGFDGTVPYSQAGLLAYEDDDRYIKLVSNVTGAGPDYDGFMYQTEFAKEILPNPYGLMFVGSPAETTWLRLTHRVDPDNGEHEFRAATSRDGESWVRGGVWSFPADTSPRIGLVSMNTPGATAEFDYVRTYRP